MGWRRERPAVDGESLGNLEKILHRSSRLHPARDCRQEKSQIIPFELYTRAAHPVFIKSDDLPAIFWVLVPGSELQDMGNSTRGEPVWHACRGQHEQCPLAASVWGA